MALQLERNSSPPHDREPRVLAAAVWAQLDYPSSRLAEEVTAAIEYDVDAPIEADLTRGHPLTVLGLLLGNRGLIGDRLELGFRASEVSLQLEVGLTRLRRRWLDP